MAINKNKGARPTNRAPIERVEGGELAAARAAGNVIREGRGRGSVSGRREWLDRYGRGGALSNGEQGGRSLNAQRIEAAYVGYHLTFGERLHALRGEADYLQLATVVQTDNVVDLNVWLNGRPTLRVWRGDKVLAKFDADAQSITTKPWEASAQVPKNDILNDRFGLYRKKIDEIAEADVDGKNNLFYAMLIGGVQGTAFGATYDGQNLIDTDHTWRSSGGVVQSNKVTGALSPTTYNTAWARYYAFKDENGRPLNVKGRRMKLVVGPNNREVARDILGSDTSGGDTNMDKGTADLVVTPYITAGTITVDGVTVTATGNEWFLMPAESAAIVIQEKRGPEFLAVEEGEFCFRTGMYLYGIESEFGGGYGPWQEIVGGPGV